ncbi:MAG: FeoC-like transcriptional regulator [Gammaproteobacteria bacterium]
MILTDLKRLLQQHPVVSLLDVCQTLRTQPNVARDMLDYWQNKGKVAKVTSQNRCNKCVQCNPLSFEMYRWEVS